MKKLISIFSAKPKAIETEKPTLRLSHSIVPDGHGTMEQFNDAWQNIHTEAYKMYNERKFSQN